MSKSLNQETCGEISAVNSDELISFLSFKGLYIFKVLDFSGKIFKRVVVTDVPYQHSNDKMEGLKISIDIERNKQMTLSQIKDVLKKANIPFEEFLVHLQISPSVDASNVVYKK